MGRLFHRHSMFHCISPTDWNASRRAKRSGRSIWRQANWPSCTTGWFAWLNSTMTEMDSINVILKNTQDSFTVSSSFPPVMEESIRPRESLSRQWRSGARAIDRQWTHLTEFHPDLLTVCRPSYFNYGYNEQFIELIDSQQMVRYNRSALLVKHIRSTTHLFCKLYLDTPTVAVRVQTLIKPGNTCV